jgi:hypothetical protein
MTSENELAIKTLRERIYAETDLLALFHLTKELQRILKPLIFPLGHGEFGPVFAGNYSNKED